MVYSCVLQFTDVLSANAYWLLTTWWLRQGLYNAGKLSTRGVYYSLLVMLYHLDFSIFSILKYFLSVAAVKLAKKSAGNHFFTQKNNKNCREITLLRLSVCQILKFASKRLNFSDFKD